jgi:hypothetical protein
LPRHFAEVSLLDSAGTTPTTQMRQGQTLLVRGRLLDQPAGTPVALDGVASILIEDSAPFQQAPECPLFPGCFRPTYYYRAGPIYRGSVAVRAGLFEGRFVVPLEASQGNRARIRAYLTGAVGASGAQDDGVGSARVSVAAGGVASDDRQGPRITLSFATGSTTVRPDAELQVFLQDPSGILTTGHSPQNAIVVTLDENTTTRSDISESFRYTTDSYQSGIATYRLPGLAPGPHRIRVSAADNLAAGLNASAHRSSATIDFLVAEVPPLEIRAAYLFPNPIRTGGPGGGGQFVIDAPGGPVNVLIRVYTVSGRLIRVLKSFGGQRQVQVPWDGRDEEGQRLANGVYLFKVHVSAREADGESSARQKGQAEGRFVVVGR